MQANTNNLNKTWTSYKQHKLPRVVVVCPLPGKIFRPFLWTSIFLVAIKD
jgi:hypothetical protein